MSNSAQNARVVKMAAPRTVPVMPNIRDGTEQQKQQKQQYKEDVDEDDSEVHDTVLNQSAKTAEEAGTEPKTNTNTMLIIVFGLIVIGLVALIVWMVMKGNKTEEETNMKQIISPGQINKEQMHQEQLHEEQRYQEQLRYEQHQEQLRYEQQQHEQQQHEKQQYMEQQKAQQTRPNENATKKRNEKQSSEKKPVSKSSSEKKSVLKPIAAKSKVIEQNSNQDGDQDGDQDNNANEDAQNPSPVQENVHQLLQGDDDITDEDKKRLSRNNEELNDNEQME